MFRINDAKFLIHTANPINIISVGKKIKTNHPDMVVMQRRQEKVKTDSCIAFGDWVPCRESF